MDNTLKSKSLIKQKDLLNKLPLSYERNIMIAEKQAQIENKNNNFYKFKYIKHHTHMNIDIYEILGKDLYGHFKRLLDTMNENNVCDLDMLDLGRTAKFTVKKNLVLHGLLKQFKPPKHIKAKLYINPLFGLNNRVTIGSDLKREFSEVNKKIYNITL